MLTALLTIATAAAVLLLAGGIAAASPHVSLRGATSINVAPGSKTGSGTVMRPANLVMRWRAGRATKRLEQQVPATLEAIARAVRAGGSLLLAIEDAAETAPPGLAGDLRIVGHRARHANLDRALALWAEERPVLGVRLAAAALALGAETGGASARAIDGVAATVRQRLSAQADARALATQARLSATVIALAPIGFGVIATATDQRLAATLLLTPVGWAMLAAGLTLDALGAAWMHAIVGRVAR